MYKDPSTEQFGHVMMLNFFVPDWKMLVDGIHKVCIDMNGPLLLKKSHCPAPLRMWQNRMILFAECMDFKVTDDEDEE